MSSAISVTLPPISDVGDGYTVLIIARSGNVTVRAYDAIYGHRESTLPAGRAALVFAEKSAGTWGAVSLDAGLSQSVSTYVDSGQIAHGDQLPKPAGYTWDDCEWVVTIEDPTCGYRGMTLRGPALLDGHPRSDHGETRKSERRHRSQGADRHTTVSRKTSCDTFRWKKCFLVGRRGGVHTRI